MRKACAVVTLLLLVASRIDATTYRVGPGEKNDKVSQVADRLKAGDVVEVTGDITDTITLTAHGTSEAPIILRGITHIENERIVRPSITADPPAGKIVICKGDWAVLEGLDISGQNDIAFRQGAVIQECSNLVVRNCRFHHCLRAFCGYEESAGDVRLEFCEFYANGYAEKPPVSLYSVKPGATAVVEHCFFLDGTGGNFLRICMPRSAVRYNWFENPYEHALQVSSAPVDGDDKARAIGDTILPAHCDIIGNVVVFGWGPGSPYCAFSLGGDSQEAPGTEGEFNIAHNLVLTRRGGATPQVAVLVHGNVDKVNLYNNVFLEVGVRGLMVYSRESVWEGYRRQKFKEARGGGEPVVSGANNWITQGAMGIPETLKDTLYGINPSFMNLVGDEFHPQPASPLAKAGLRALPKGQVASLVPECEPRRGIPVDLKPIFRREVAVPAIGPFEASATPPPFGDDSADLILGVKDSGGRFAWPFDFGAWRRSALENLHTGKHAEALACAKMEFLLSPMDQPTLDAAIESVKQMLVAVDGDDTRAEAFEEYARYGTAGRDGQKQTSDDLENPISNVDLSLFAKSNSFYEAWDTTIDNLAAIGSDTPWIMKAAEGSWYKTEKIFSRIETGCFEEALRDLVALLPGTVKEPALDFDGDKRAKLMQRNQGIIERIVGGLNTVLRSKSGSNAGIRELTQFYIDYAKYGTEGKDGRMGTPDDLVPEDADRSTAALWAETLRHGTVPSGNPELSPDARQHVNGAIDAIGQATQAALTKGELIASHSHNPEAVALMCVGPTSQELMRRTREQSSLALRLVQGVPRDERQHAEDAVLSVAENSCRTLVDEYARFLALVPSEDMRKKARAFMSAYILGISDIVGYERILRILSEEGANRLTPVSLVSDAVECLEAPFLADNILDVIARSLPDAISEAEKRASLALIETSEYDVIRSADKCIMAARAMGQHDRTYDVVIAQCDLYLKRFQSMPRAGEVKFFRGFYGYRAGRYEDAVKDLDSFCNENTSSPLLASAHFAAALATVYAGRESEGLERLERVALDHADNPVAPKALLTAGQLCAKATDYTKAKGYFLRASELYPADASGREAKALLDKLSETVVRATE